jgi:hypothetical protein
LIGLIGLIGLVGWWRVQPWLMVYRTGSKTFLAKSLLLDYWNVIEMGLKQQS